MEEREKKKEGRDNTSSYSMTESTMMQTSYTTDCGAGDTCTHTVSCSLDGKRDRIIITALTRVQHKKREIKELRDKK